MKKPTVMLIIQNTKEKEILDMAFNQRKIETISTAADHNAYLKTIQFVPDTIILQIPKKYMNQSRYLTSIKSNPKTNNIPIIAYTSKKNEEINLFLKSNKISRIYTRPLKFSTLIKNITTFLEQNGKKLDIQEKLNDIQKDAIILFDKKINSEEKINVIANYTSKLLAFPHTLTKVISISNNNSKGANDLGKIIKNDPTITGTILKLSNSIFFARNKRKIVNINEAIVRIGLNETKRIVMAISAMEMFNNEEKVNGFNREDFWIHSLTTGIIAEKISQNFKSEIDPNISFILGIMHSFSLLIVDSFFSPFFNKMINYTINKSASFDKISLKISGFKPNKITAALFEKWEFPNFFQNCIKEYNGIDEKKEKFNKEDNIYSYIINLSDKISKSLNLGKECDLYMEPINNNLMKLLKLQTGVRGDFLEYIKNEFKMYKSFFNFKTSEQIDQTFDKKINFINISKELFVPLEHFLTECKFDINNITTLEEIKNIEETQNHIFLFWIGPKTTNDMIENFTKEINKKISPKKFNDYSIFFIDKKYEFKEYIKSLKSGYYFRSFDLRTIFTLINQDQYNRIIPYEPDLKDIDKLREEIKSLIENDNKGNNDLEATV